MPVALGPAEDMMGAVAVVVLLAGIALVGSSVLARITARAMRLDPTKMTDPALSHSSMRVAYPWLKPGLVTLGCGIVLIVVFR